MKRLILITIALAMVIACETTQISKEYDTSKYGAMPAKKNVFHWARMAKYGGEGEPPPGSKAASIVPITDYIWTTKFSPQDRIYCVSIMDLTRGTEIEGKWYYKPPGDDIPYYPVAVMPFRVPVSQIGTHFVQDIHPTTKEGIPIGNYKVEIRMNGKLMETLHFEIIQGG